VADIGCGSGAIAVALAYSRPDLQIIATDISAPALEIAKANAHRHGLLERIQFAQGDLYAPLAGLQLDVIVANPPYIAAADAHLHQGDLRFEPPCALTDQADGLAILRRLAKHAHEYLRPGGWLALEHGYDQGSAVADLLSAAGLENVRTHTDLFANPRNTTGQMPQHNGPGNP
jgi:release factor glutamine methyltransferase